MIFMSFLEFCQFPNWKFAYLLFEINMFKPNIHSILEPNIRTRALKG